jgi:hypothetical protein
MTSWVAAGQPLAAYWHATPIEFAAAIAGEQRRLDARRDIAVIGGWVAGVEQRLKDVTPMTNEQMSMAWTTFAEACPGMVTMTFEPFDFEESDE